ADMCSAKGHVRFTPESGHVRCKDRCLLWAISGHTARELCEIMFPHTIPLCRSWSTEKREPFAYREQQIVIGSVNNFIQRSCHSEQDLGLSRQFIAGWQLRQVH